MRSADAPDPVFVAWRPVAPAVPGVTGRVVAVEFLSDK